MQLRPLTLAACFAASVHAWHLPPACKDAPVMSRRQLAATAFGALPLLVSRAASAGFAKTVDDIPEERLKQLEKNRGPQLGDDMAFRMVCDRDDEQCLAEKREKGKLKLPGSDGPITQEERSAAIQKQAKACRAFCGRVTLADCDGRDTACLERKREEMKAAGASICPSLPAMRSSTSW